MTTLVSGPAWSKPGLDIVGGRYPLRVERHLSRLVDGLLPGVITTTPHARSYALHTLVWAEAMARGLDAPDAIDLMRRCEVVLASVTLQHTAHATWIPEPHGAFVIGRAMEEAGHVDVAALAAPQSYSQNAWGFAGVYLGSEQRLGLLEGGSPPSPGPRSNYALLSEALGDVVELAGQDTLDLASLASASHLCACAGPTASDGEWLRSVLVSPAPLEGFEQADQARRSTAQLLGRVLVPSSPAAPQDRFRHTLAFGDFIERDPVASLLPIAQAWRGAILRYYSVGAWRRLWSWLVDLLGEPSPVRFLADQLADALPAVSVQAMLDALPDRAARGVLLPLEDDLRSAHWAPDPLTEVQLLAIGALRLDDLSDRSLVAFAGSGREDDLGPHWFRAQLEARRSESLRDFGRWLAEMMVQRAQRVALTKMEFNRSTGRFWIPSRIRERAGLISRRSPEGWADVGLRIDTFSSVLAGCGVFERLEDGMWRLTPNGEADLG
jgi:hypothetical protein